MTAFRASQPLSSETPMYWSIWVRSGIESRCLGSGLTSLRIENAPVGLYLPHSCTNVSCPSLLSSQLTQTVAAALWGAFRSTLTPRECMTDSGNGLTLPQPDCLWHS